MNPLRRRTFTALRAQLGLLSGLLVLSLALGVTPPLYAAGSGPGGSDQGESGDGADAGPEETDPPVDGDPLNLAKGNYLTRHTDLTVRGPLPLTFARTYDSLRSSDNAMGWKWDHSLNTRLYEVHRIVSSQPPPGEGITRDNYDPRASRPTAQRPSEQQPPPPQPSRWVYYPPIADAPPADAEKVAVIIAMASPTGTKRLRFEKSANGYTAPPGVFHTLTDAAGGGYALRSKHGTTWTFDADGQLVRREDRNGNAHVYTRGPEGRVDSVSNGGGRFIRLTYDNNGHVTTASDHTGRMVTYTHSGEGDLTAIRTPAIEGFPNGIVRGYTYDANHNVVTAVDGNGQTYLTNTWDAEGRTVVGQLYAGATCTIDYDFAPNTTRYTDWRGFHTDYEYDDNGNTLTETRHSTGLRPGDPATWVTTHEYDADFKRTRTVYPRGNWTKYTYDDRGNLTEVRSKGINAPAADDPANDRVRRWTFDPQFSQITSYTDPEGNVTTYQLDARGNTVAVSRPEVPDTTYTYHPNGLGWLASATAPDGVVTRYEYFDDEAADGPRYGYLKATVRDAGPGTADLNARTEYAYDDLGNLTGVTDPEGRATTATWNALRKLERVISAQPFGFVSRFTYEGNLRLDRVEQQADPAATTWQNASFTYDLRGLPTRIDLQDGEAVVQIEYDDGGLPVAVTDPEGRRSEATYDERGFLLHQTDALGHRTAFAYDPNANLTRLTDANGVATTYAHDSFDRQSQVTYADGSFEAWAWNPAGTLATLTTRAGATFTYAYDDLHRRTQKVTPEQTYGYTYDDRSRLLTASNAAGTVTMAYDDLGRLTSETDVHGRTLGFSHDLTGNRTGLTYPDGTTVNHEHDRLDRLERIRGPNNQPLVSFGYDTLSRYASLTHANGTSSSFGFDLRDNLQRISHALGGQTLDWDYTTNLAGVRTAVDAPEGRYEYGYDNAWRLTQVDEPASIGGSTIQYDLDPLGNRRSVTEDGTATPYVANALNQYTAVGGQQRTFDANGNLASDGVRTYTYDSENRLREVQLDFPFGPQVVTFAYDAFGRRVTRQLNGGQELRYTYDGWDIVEETHVPTGGRVRFVNGPSIDQPLQRTAPDGTVHTFHQDALGSVVAVTDASGAVVERYRYDAYGTPTILDPAGNPRSASTLGNDRLYTARRWDPLTRLYHYRNRDYDPAAGRFLQPDPLGYVDGPNVYAYVESSPTNLHDPLGLTPPAAAAATAIVVFTPVDEMIAGAVVTGWAIWGGSRTLPPLSGHPADLPGMTPEEVEKIREEHAPEEDEAADDEGTPQRSDKPTTKASDEAGDNDGDNQPEAEPEAEEPASEQEAKKMGQRIERDLDEDARREFHDAKRKGEPDRTMRQLKEDAQDVYINRGRDVPEWFQ